MPKKTISKKITREIKDYLSILKKDKLPIEKAVLFGSYAKETQSEISDIDLCIISPRFKNAFKAMQYLYLKRTNNKTPVISPIGFSPKDFNDNYDTLIQEIKKTGIEIFV